MEPVWIKSKYDKATTKIQCYKTGVRVVEGYALVSNRSALKYLTEFESFRRITEAEVPERIISRFKSKQDPNQKICALPGCNKVINIKRKYCSRQHSMKHTSIKRTA